ncbi:MAG: phosphotransferase [Candidatus Uhrbacteria bacterium]|nr:phosphotransferase [Candidatus Uhrbacteria bacterium]
MRDSLPTLAKFIPATSEERTAVAEVLFREYGWRLTSHALARAINTSSSDVFRTVVEPVGAIILKISSWFHPPKFGGEERVIRSLNAVYELSERLRGKGVPLAPTLASKSGAWVVSCDRRPAVVMSCVEGVPFNLSDEHFIASGAALGQFHAMGRGWLDEHSGQEEALQKMILVEMPYEESRTLYGESMRTDLRQPHIGCQAPEVCAAVREQMEFLDQTISFIDASGINAKERAHGILHNDVNGGNILFAPDGSVSAFLDFDQASFGPFVWDLGNTLTSFMTEFLKKNPEGDRQSKVRLFLQAYHTANVLPVEEYVLILAATQRWDVMRILRSLRRHHYEDNRLPGLLSKIKERLLPRLERMPILFSFLTENWIRENVLNPVKDF